MSILSSAELLLQAKNYSGSGAWLDESGNGHDAQLGSTSGADTNDPLFKAYIPKKYCYFPGVNGNRWSTPSAVGLDFTGLDAEFRFDVTLADYTPAAQFEWGRRIGSSPDQVFFGRVATDGKLSLVVYVDGTASSTFTSTVATGVTDTVRQQFKIEFDGDDGSSGKAVKFYKRAVSVALDDDSVAWTQIGDTVTNATVMSWKAAPTATLVSSAASVEANYDLWRWMMFDGIGGAVLFDAVFNDATEPFATFTERSSSAATVTIARSGVALVSTVVDRDLFVLSTDNYFEIPDDAALDITAGDALTTMVVFRANTVASGSDVLLAKKDNLTTSLGYALVRNTTNSQGIIADGTLDDTDEKLTIAVHTLHTAAFVRNTVDDDIEAFLDGVGSGSATTDSTTTTLANAFPLRIGATSNTAASFFEGVIIAVAVWTSALTDAEIAAAHTLLMTSSTGSMFDENIFGFGHVLYT